MSLLFEMPQCDGMRAPLHAHREELQRELSDAVKACDSVPDWFLDIDEAKQVFRHLAEDGDDSAAREELHECFEMSAGFGKFFDLLMDHINTVSFAYWRLHRAERRAYGKEII